MNNNALGFGCVSLSSHRSLGSAIRLLDKAYESGITYFDTAPLYGQGFSEKIVNEFIKSKRKNLSIATKVGLNPSAERNIPVKLALLLNYAKQKLKPANDDSQSEPGKPVRLHERVLDHKFVKESVEKSFKRLGTNYIDRLLLHEAMPSFLTDEALLYLIKCREKGDILQLGIACSYVNYSAAEINRFPDFEVLQYEYAPMLGSDDVTRQFPDKTHIYHSAFKFIHRCKAGENKKEAMRNILRGIDAINPNGRILFSTTKIEHLVDNVELIREI